MVTLIVVENDVLLEVQVDDGVLEIQTEEEVLTTVINSIEKGGTCKYMILCPH